MRLKELLRVMEAGHEIILSYSLNGDDFWIESFQDEEEINSKFYEWYVENFRYSQMYKAIIITIKRGE